MTLNVLGMTFISDGCVVILMSPRKTYTSLSDVSTDGYHGNRNVRKENLQRDKGVSTSDACVLQYWGLTSCNYFLSKNSSI